MHRSSWVHNPGNRIVMIVDDSALIRRQVATALAPSGFVVLPAHDGIDALEKLSCVSGVALILCDINMPRMDGMQFLSEFGKTNNVSVPVVMLTTESEPDLLEHAKALGASGWITKPFNAATVVLTVRKLVATA